LSALTAVQLTPILPDDGRDVVNPVTFAGVVRAVTELDALEESDTTPVLVVAITVNVYAVPEVRPLTDIGLDAPLPVCPPEEVTVYEEMVPLPAYVGAVKGTLIVNTLPECEAVPIVGVSGFFPPVSIRVIIFPYIQANTSIWLG
jgi:hypothetical protein